MLNSNELLFEGKGVMETFWLIGRTGIGSEIGIEYAYGGHDDEIELLKKDDDDLVTEKMPPEMNH